MLFFYFGPEDDWSNHWGGIRFFTVAHHAQYGEEPPIIQDIGEAIMMLDSVHCLSTQDVGLALERSEILNRLIEKHPDYEKALLEISLRLRNSRIVNHVVSLPIWMRCNGSADHGLYVVQMATSPISKQ